MVLHTKPRWPGYDKDLPCLFMHREWLILALEIWAARHCWSWHNVGNCHRRTVHVFVQDWNFFCQWRAPGREYSSCRGVAQASMTMICQFDERHRDRNSTGKVWSEQGKIIWSGQGSLENSFLVRRAISSPRGICCRAVSIEPTDIFREYAQCHYSWTLIWH